MNGAHNRRERARFGEGKNWRRVLAQHVRNMTPEQAREVLVAHGKRGPSIGDPAYRALTGGLSSQSIDFEVTTKLAQRAGLRR